MKIFVTDSLGRTATVDNEGEVNKQVIIYGDPDLIHHLHQILNVKVTIPFQGMLNSIDESLVTYSEEGVAEIYKASNKYMVESFIAVDCPAFGYVAEIILGE